MAHVQASTSVATSFAYECASCDYTGRARVRGEGYAEADGSDVEADAVQDAEGAAWNDALTTVELAPCPRCGARDRVRWNAWMRAQLVGVLAWGALAALVGSAAIFLLHQRMDFTPIAVGGAAWVLVAIGSMTQRIGRKRSRAQTLRFDPPR